MAQLAASTQLQLDVFERYSTPPIRRSFTVRRAIRMRGNF